jgi:aromatic ring-cleaving dioxygenase
MKRAKPRKTSPDEEPLKTRALRRRQPDEPLALRFQAIWLDGPVPSGFWHDFRHRRLYVLWLGHKLGFRKPEDWYRITSHDFKRNRGGGLLNAYWCGSVTRAVKEYFPDYDWKEWLFGMTPLRFWHDPRNHRRYMKWLGQQLGIRRPSDWYRVGTQDFYDHKGGAFLLCYNSTVSRAIMSYLPNYDWKEWLFDMTPARFWREKKNRRRYMIWLGKKLGFKSTTDWYSVIYDDFRANDGIQFLKLYNQSPVAAVKDCFPEHTWNEWMFARVPLGFWDKLANRKRYLRWLGKKLGFKRPQDWHRVARRDFIRNCGGGLVEQFHSHLKVLKGCVPGFK